MRVRDRALAVTRARQSLAAALEARDRAFAAASDDGVAWSELADASGVSPTSVRRAVVHRSGRTASAWSAEEGVWLAIDTAGTRIREDAFRVRNLLDRRWLVEVCSPAVADVCALDGVLDRGARDRASVIERGGARQGMFPRRLETELSFGPGFSGHVLVVAFTLDPDAQRVTDVDIRRDTICEGDIAALSYEDSDHLLDTCADHNPAYHALAAAHGLVKLMAGAGRRDVHAQSIVTEIMTSANVAATSPTRSA